MKNRRWLALLLALCGAYLLVHAGMAGKAVYGVSHALQNPAVVSDSDLGEMRESYSTLVALFALLSVLGVTSVAASVGFARRSKWAFGLWLATSVALVSCVVYAVVFYHVAWTHYVPETAIIALSWWYFVAMGKESA